MRKHVMWVSATLALALGAVTGCGGSPQSGSAGTSGSCIDQSAAHHAYIVVMHGSTKTLQRCVGFSADTIDAQSVMDRSKIEYQTQDFGPGLGKAVCQLDNEPSQYTKCFPDNGPYWTLFIETNGHWAPAQTGYSQVTLHDKDALGWVYTASASPSPPPAARE